MTIRIILTFYLFILGLSLGKGQDAESGRQTIEFFDSTRNRKLVTEIWLPAGGSKMPYPLVMFSHGTGGNRLASQWFCADLAKNGFMVAAVDHFGNTFDNPIPEEFVRIWNRPKDISFVLTEMLNEKQFQGQINQNSIFAAGFSLGGYTSLALAGADLDWNALSAFFKTEKGLQEINISEMPGLGAFFEKEEYRTEFNKNAPFKDQRIKGVFVMAPALGQGFKSKSQMKRVDIPVTIVGAKQDAVAPVETNAAHYKKLIPNAKWHLIEGDAGHYVFLNEGNADMKKFAPTYFVDAEGVDRSAIHSQVASMGVKFFQEILSSGAKAK